MKRAVILRKLVDNTGLSVKAFSERAGVPYTTVRSIFERGVGNTSVDNIIKLCKALNITIEDLENMAQNDTTNITTLAAHRNDGYDGPLNEDEAIAVKAFLESYRKMKQNKEE